MFIWEWGWGLSAIGCRLSAVGYRLSAVGCRLSPTHWIFRSLMLPYKSSSHSAKCVRCASLRSGGRRLAVRTAMEHPIGALPRTPFPASRDFPSRGNERYDGKNSESYTSRTISAFSLFGGCHHHLARWEACHMTQKVNPVTLALYSLPDRAIHNPRPERPSNLRTLRPERAGQS